MTPFRTLPVLLALALAAVAQDDRDRSTPTVSQFLTGQTALDLQGLVNTGWRFTDLEIESTSPWAFTVVAVANTGAYYKSWQYFLGVTASQLHTSATANNQRPIDVEPYDDNGTTRYCAISIANTGADQKTWTLFSDQPTVPAVFSTQLLRYTNLERYLSSGQTAFAVVSVDNSTNHRNWTYALSRTQAQLAASSFRVYDLERNGSNSYDAIQIEDDGTEHWLYFDRTATQLADLQRQNLGRIVDVERHTVLVLGTRYDAVMLDNANELERRARRAFVDAPGALGKHGFFLKQVNGPVLAEMMADAPFEPAGAMCSLYHVHAMKQVATGAASLATAIDKPAACGVAGAPQSLELTLAQMMENGDDLAALAVSNHFGLANIDGSAGALGMVRTDIHYTIGCSGPVPQSTMTLRDLSTLHEQVANGYLGAQRAKFYQLMPEDLSFPGTAVDDLDARIDAEAAGLGLPVSVRDAFKAALHIAHGPGGVASFEGGAWHYYHCDGGWMSVPYKDALGQITPIEYTFGAFHHDFGAPEVEGRDAMRAAELELVWDRVRSALATWDNHQVGTLLPLGGAGCLGTGGVPIHTATGLPELTRFAHYHLDRAPANAIYVAVFGFSPSDYQGIPLPLDLGVIGAPGCILRTSVDVQMPGLAAPDGTATTTITIGTDPSTIGTIWYSQHLVLDPPANAFGATLSNAWQTTVGGWL